MQHTYCKKCTCHLLEIHTLKGLRYIKVCIVKYLYFQWCVIHCKLSSCRKWRISQATDQPSIIKARPPIIGANCQLRHPTAKPPISPAFFKSGLLYAQPCIIAATFLPSNLEVQPPIGPVIYQLSHLSAQSPIRQTTYQPSPTHPSHLSAEPPIKQNPTTCKPCRLLVHPSSAQPSYIPATYHSSHLSAHPLINRLLFRPATNQLC